jgi:hypothetical protein
MQKEVAAKLAQVATKARTDFGVSLDGFKATFTNRGKRQIVSYKRENGKVVARFNAKWLTDENRVLLLDNLVPHIVARQTNAELQRTGIYKGPVNIAIELGATASQPLAGLKTPTTCKRTPKAKNWAYLDSKGNKRWVSTRIHNRMQREGVVYTYKDNGAKIDRTSFLG